MAGYHIRDAKFIVSNTTVAKCPAPDLPEFAFIGRSNVGKSSLINMLTTRKGLAKISATPGKTQLINHFLVNEEWYLVDLPGYGYARISRSTKSGWDKMIRDYITKRESLLTVFVLVDIRHEPQKIDLEFINWLGEQRIPLAIVFTKSDKLSKQQVIASLEAYKRSLRQFWEELPMLFITSADKRIGREEILEYITASADGFIPPRKG